MNKVSAIPPEVYDANADNIRLDELENINIDELEHLTDDELYAHFKTLAEKASEGLLRYALNITVEDEVYEYDTLVKIFADRKIKAAIDLRKIEV